MTFAGNGRWGFIKVYENIYGNLFENFSVWPDNDEWGLKVKIDPIDVVVDELERIVPHATILMKPGPSKNQTDYLGKSPQFWAEGISLS